LKDAVCTNELGWKNKAIDEKMLELERLVVQTAVTCKSIAQQVELPRGADELELKVLIDQRSRLGITPHSRDDRVKLSKQIQREIRKTMRSKKTNQIQERLQQFTGLRQLGNIRANGKKRIIASVIDKHGMHQSDRQAIANVFADFYADLYAHKDEELNGPLVEEETEERVEAFTVQEAIAQLGSMAKGKAPDASGLVVEMLRDGSNTLLRIIVDLFNDILAH
jgi:hypothetical protein